MNTTIKTVDTVTKAQSMIKTAHKFLDAKFAVYARCETLENVDGEAIFIEEFEVLAFDYRWLFGKVDGKTIPIVTKGKIEFLLKIVD